MAAVADLTTASPPDAAFGSCYKIKISFAEVSADSTKSHAAPARRGQWQQRSADGRLRLRALLVWETATRGAFDNRQHRHFLALRDGAGHRRHGSYFVNAAAVTLSSASLCTNKPILGR